jgi:hypothetical protein
MAVDGAPVAGGATGVGGVTMAGGAATGGVTGGACMSAGAAWMPALCGGRGGLPGSVVLPELVPG